MKKFVPGANNVFQFFWSNLMLLPSKDILIDPEFLKKCRQLFVARLSSTVKQFANNSSLAFVTERISYSAKAFLLSFGEKLSPSHSVSISRASFEQFDDA